MPETTAKPRPGRPSKKSAETVAKVLEVAATGLPLRFACAAGNITIETLCQWRNHDRQFAQAFENARLVAVRRRWDQIAQAAEGTQEERGSWQAAAWALERSFPRKFGKPEVQLNVQANTQVNIGNEFVIDVKGAEVVENRTRELDCEVQQMFEARQKLSE